MSDEEAFDLFSTSIVKVKSTAGQEREEANRIQLAAAGRMGDVPREQLPEQPHYSTFDDEFITYMQKLFDALFAYGSSPLFVKDLPHFFFMDLAEVPAFPYREPLPDLSPKEKRKANWMNLNAKGKPWMKRR